MKRINIFALMITFLFTTSFAFAEGEMHAPMEPDWSFQGPLGKFDRAELHRSLCELSFNGLGKL